VSSSQPNGLDAIAFLLPFRPSPTNMVAVKFEGLEGACALEDCYVSVRIGNVQKLSRMSLERRVYDFPETGEANKSGRVEIFRRVAACSIDLDSQAGSRIVRWDATSTVDPFFENVNIEVLLDEDTSTKDTKDEVTPVSNAPQGKRVARRQMATDYLGKHCLESQLASMMKAVLQEMPANPTEFLAARFLEQCEPTVDGRMRLGPVAAPSAPDTQDNTLPRPPAEPALQRGRRPASDARRLTPLPSTQVASESCGSSAEAAAAAPADAECAAMTAQAEAGAEAVPAAIQVDGSPAEIREPDLNYVSSLDFGASPATPAADANDASVPAKETPPMDDDDTRDRLRAALTCALQSGELLAALDVVLVVSRDANAPNSI